MALLANARKSTCKPENTGYLCGNIIYANYASSCEGA